MTGQCIGALGARFGQFLGRSVDSELLSPSRKLRPLNGPRLADLGVHDMVLLTNSPRTLVALQGFALNLVGHRPMFATSPSSWIR